VNAGLRHQGRATARAHHPNRVVSRIEIIEAGQHDIQAVVLDEFDHFREMSEGDALRRGRVDQESMKLEVDANRIEQFQPIPAITLLTLGSVLTIVAGVHSVGRAMDTLVTAERRNFAQAWRLRQILPGPAQPR
jgi:hypothetical protein